MEPDDAVMELEHGAWSRELGALSRLAGRWATWWRWEEWSECSAYAMRTDEMGSSHKRHSKKIVSVSPN